MTTCKVTERVLNLEELARKANLAQMNNAPEGVFIVDAQALSLFAALVLEKAADLADSRGHHWSGEPSNAFFSLADELRAMSGSCLHP